jgi:hypothetical protein
MTTVDLKPGFCAACDDPKHIGNSCDGPPVDWRQRALMAEADLAVLRQQFSNVADQLTALLKGATL